MNFEPIRQAFQPLFGLDRRETVSRLLRTILICVIVVDSIVILQRLWVSNGTLTPTIKTLIGLLVLQFVLFYISRRGFTELAAVALAVVSWGLITYEIWITDGIRDVAFYLYILIIFMAALLTTLRISIILSILSITSIWTFAILEVLQIREPTLAAPLTLAGDLTAIFVLLILFVYLVSNNVLGSLDAVRVGEEKFRKVFHVSPVAISITSFDNGALLDANEAYLRLIGYDRESAIGRTTTEVGIWRNASERKVFVGKMREKKSLHEPAFRFTSRSGDEHVAHAYYELIDVGNEPVVLSMFHDVTEQKKIQRALQSSEEKYRNFIEQSMEGIWYLGFDEPISTNLPPEEQVDLIYKCGFIAECNDALAQMYGYNSSEELRGSRLTDGGVEHSIDAMNFQATLKLVRDNYRSGNRETRENTRNGETVYFLNNAVGVIKDNYLVGLWGTQLDITALKVAEDALRRSENRTRALLNSIPDMIFEFNREGRILQFIPSQANEPLMPPEQFLGKVIGEVIPDLANQTMFFIERALETGHMHAFQYEMVESGRNRMFEARITPLGPDTVLAMVRDMSLQKWIEDEREKLISELESKTSELETKNAELERFTYTVSHDLKSPLITIRGFLGFLREDSQSGNLVRLDADIKRISDATEKMQRLLNDLLELSRVGRLMNEPQEIQLNELIAEALELVQGRISAGNIEVSVVHNLPHVYGDYQRLIEVMQNLIDNAAKFMGSQPSPRIEIGQRGTLNGMPVIYIRDNGIGIPSEFQENIFGLFNKLDARTEGTGVGLALVKRIVEFHHGGIWVESEPGKGTTFLITLPNPPK